MSKFFIGFLIIFAVVGVAYRLNINMSKPAPVTFATYTNDELGFTLQYKDGAPITIGDPIIVPDGAKPLDTMASTTVLDGSGMNPKASVFTKEITKNTTVYYIKSGQFEGVVSYDAYFVKDNFIIPLRYAWDGVDWTNPKYDSTQDPKFKEFMDVLRSIQFIHQEKGIYEGI